MQATRTRLQSVHDALWKIVIYNMLLEAYGVAKTRLMLVSVHYAKHTHHGRIEEL